MAPVSMPFVAQAKRRNLGKRVADAGWLRRGGVHAHTPTVTAKLRQERPVWTGLEERGCGCAENAARGGMERRLGAYAPPALCCTRALVEEQQWTTAWMSRTDERYLFPIFRGMEM